MKTLDKSRMPTAQECEDVRLKLLAIGHDPAKVEAYVTGNAGLRCWLDLSENCGLKRSVEEDFLLIAIGRA
jgi:hypothetical protein